MDKYAVDIDQVLNDFEYSELTDSQQNLAHAKAAAAAVPSQINNVFPSTSQAGPLKVKNINSKHSITNVFNSLNEYLNSDIGISKDKNTHAEFNPNNVNNYASSNKDNFHKENINAEQTKICANVHILAPLDQPTNSNQEYNNATGFQKCETSTSAFIDFSPENEKYTDLDVKSIQKAVIENKYKGTNVADTDNTNLIDTKLANTHLESEAVDVSVDSGNNVSEVVNQPTNENNVELCLETSDVTTQASCDDVIDDIAEETHNIEENENFSDATQEINEHEPVQVDKPVDLDATTTIKNIETNEIPVAKVLGFENVEYDEEQLNKYLDELEDETMTVKTTVADTHDTEKPNDGDAIVKENIEEMAEYLAEEASKNTLIVNIPEQSKEIVSFVEENSEFTDKPEENLDSINTSQKVGDEINTETHVMEADAASKKKVKRLSYKNADVAATNNNDSSELTSASDVCEHSPDVSVVPNITLEVHNDSESPPSLTTSSEELSSEEVNSSERPKTLDISNDSSESKREINLIGNPGSTPYNNVYVSKEISTKEPKNLRASDTDSSCSASPTFSNASTNSVNSTETSTDSTDDCADESPKRVKEPVENGLPHKHKDSDEKMQIGVDVSNANEVTNEQHVQNSTIIETEQSTDETASNIADEPVDNTENIPEASATASLDDNSDTNSAVSHQESDLGAAGDTSEGYLDQAMGIDYSESSMIPSAVPWLGKQAPDWIPDAQAISCLHCDVKFTVIKRRHHCRACGLVLCSKCCNLKYKLEFLDGEARVCFRCYELLNKDTISSSGSEAMSPSTGNSPNRMAHQPNPNNPMEYCSVVPPLQQVSNVNQNPPTVMVPVGVLKRKGSSKGKSNKSVMFCDGIRPGSDLTNLDTDFNYSEAKTSSSALKKLSSNTTQSTPVKHNKNLPLEDPVTKSFIPADETSLPPTVTLFKSDISYTECANSVNVVEMLKNETLTFAIHRNLYVHVKIINMNCCINKLAWCFSTEGLITVGQDEVVYLLECLPEETSVPKDLFYHINSIYADALKGTTITDMSISLHPTQNFLGSKNHAGFLYIRPTFQCLKNVIVPKELYLVGILIHRWEIPWAKILPLRLILRLGAEYRYYPSPIISTRNRDSVYVEIGHTFINLLADFRNFMYTLPNIMGLTVHMEDKNTTVTIPSNRYDQVMKSINDSSDHILAFAGNFSTTADTHLVCIQDTQGSNENSYSTHAINIEKKPRKITGASFIVFNGALKSSSGLTAKSTIVEDGLMIQIPADNMVQVRESLRNMKNYTIHCGCVNAESDETVNIVWGDPDINFNINVISPIDKKPLSGIPSIRVHNGKDFVCNSGNRLIRWTEVFILENGEEAVRSMQGPVDISKLAESISKATCFALVKYLDLLASNNFYKVGIRTILHVDDVSYWAGSNGVKLPPIYMRSLDNELIPVLHRITSNNFGENVIILELIFRILNV